MPLVHNGTTIENVVFNGTPLTAVVFNGTTVYQKQTSRTYIYKAKAARCGTTGLGYGTQDGVFRVDNQAGMWCFKNDVDDTNYNVLLSNCLNKNIQSIKFVAYRANTVASSAAGNTSWTYGVTVSNSGISTIYNRGVNHIDRALTTPLAVGQVVQDLTTAELQTIFSPAYLNIGVPASGSGVYAMPAGDYWAFGVRALYSPGQIQFRCDNVNYADAYLEIITQE